MNRAADTSTRLASAGLTLLAGIGIGTALMYFLDPDRGKGRVSRAREQVRSSARNATGALGRRAHDLRNRTRGTVAELRGRAGERRRERPLDDDTLVARVRAELGHHTERARHIEVAAEGGTVTLRGRVPATEVPHLLGAVQAVRGVDRVDNQLDLG
jgi:osmotically-inducible protein OsmY